MIKHKTALLPLMLAVAGAAAAGEFSSTSITESLSWSPSDCPEPVKPDYAVDSVETYNAAVDAYNAYLKNMRTYRECMIEEAQKDANESSAAISSGVNQVNENIGLELESMRSELETAKESLQ